VLGRRRRRRRERSGINKTFSEIQEFVLLLLVSLVPTSTGGTESRVTIKVFSCERTSVDFVKIRIFFFFFVRTTRDTTEENAGKGDCNCLKTTHCDTDASDQIQLLREDFGKEKIDIRRLNKKRLK
jgi:hypothetical protein